MIRGALGSRYGISPLGSGVIRPSSGGWWLSGGIAAANCVAAYRAKGAADYATSKVNLANPGTYDAINGAAYPTWDVDTGWTFTRTSSQYLTSSAPADFKPVTLIARIINSGTTGDRGIFGGSGINGGFELRVNNSINKLQFLRQAQALLGTSNTSVSSGLDSVVAISYSSIGAFQFYYNGNTDGNGIQNQVFTLGRTLQIGLGYIGEYFNGQIICCSIYNIALTGSQIVALTTAMNAL